MLKNSDMSHRVRKDKNKEKKLNISLFLFKVSNLLSSFFLLVYVIT